MNQRWRNRREIYRPAGELIDSREYEICETSSDRIVREFIATHHYQQTTPPARFRFCLHRAGRLVGVAVFGHPTNDRSITGMFGCPAIDDVELSRLVLLDEVPGNGESFFVGACLRSLRRLGFAGVITFSDPVARRSQDGLLVKRGHCGTVYQALGSRFVGRSAPRTLRLLPDGNVLNERSIQKLRTGEPGTRAIRETLSRLGVSLPEGALGERLTPILDRYTQRLRHGGNYKYVWCFSAAAERHLPPALPYPKLDPLFHYCTER